MSPTDTPRTVARESGEGTYGTLVFISFLALAIAVGVMYFYTTELTGDPNPFAIVDSP